MYRCHAQDSRLILALLTWFCAGSYGFAVRMATAWQTNICTTTAQGRSCCYSLFQLEARASGDERVSNFSDCETSALQKSDPNNSTATAATIQAVEEVAADERTYHGNLQLRDIAAQSNNRGQKDTSKVELALTILRDMGPYADTVAFNTVLKVLAKTGQSTHRALTLLQQMKEVNHQQRKARTQWYDKLATGLLSNGEVEKGPPRIRVKPNVRSYGTVMDAFARNGSVASAQQVEKLLVELQQKFDESNDEALRPNLIIYNTVLAAWSKTGQGADRCEEIILHEMPIRPDVISYNSAMHGIARSGVSDAGPRAERLLRHITENGKQGELVPNQRSYAICMHAWSQVRRPERAQQLLIEMKRLHEQTNNPMVAPNCVSYATVIHAYAISQDPDKVKKAYLLYREMKSSGIHSNQVLLNNLINCCATSSPTPMLVPLVESIYNESLERHQPDQFTFGTVLKACNNLMLWDDERFPVEVFREACARGQVSAGVLQQFWHSVPIDVYRSLVGDDCLTIVDLPSKWSCNVEKKRQRRRSRRTV